MLPSALLQALEENKTPKIEQLAHFEMIDWVKLLFSAEAIALESMFKLDFKAFVTQTELCVNDEERRELIVQEIRTINENLSDERSRILLQLLYEPISEIFTQFPIISPLLAGNEEFVKEELNKLPQPVLEILNMVLESGLFKNGLVEYSAMDVAVADESNSAMIFSTLPEIKKLILPILQLHYKREYVFHLKSLLEDKTKYNSSVYWKGKSSADFATLVYGMQEAGLIENESGRATDLVQQMAGLLNYELPSSWLVSFTRRAADDKASTLPPILTKIQKGYGQYIQKKIR